MSFTAPVLDLPSLESCPNCQAQWKYTVDCYECDGSGVDANGNACTVHSCSYNRHTERFDGACTAHCCQDGTRGPFSRIIGVEYDYTSADRYDGVSEWRCPSCATRWGRWSGRVLHDGETERVFG